MSTRRLAGSRRNKHLPIVPSFDSDWASATRARVHRHYTEAAARFEASWPGMGASLLAKAAQYRDPAQGSKPDHAARAVDIHAIWPPLNLDDERNSTRRIAAESGARGKSAAPMDRQRRIDAYQRHNILTGDRAMTERQFRQLQRTNIRAAFAAA